MQLECWPLPPEHTTISQKFGEHPEWYLPYGLAGHEGWDFPCPVETPTFATHDGWIDPSWRGEYGNSVRIRGEGFFTFHAHLIRTIGAYGQTVHAGQIIGETGATGVKDDGTPSCTGPHLHWGIKEDGVSNPPFKGWLDPEPYLRRFLMRPKTSLHWQSLHDWSRRAMTDWLPVWVKVMNPPETGVDPFPEIQYKDIRFHTDGWDNSYIARGEQGGHDYVQHLLARILACPWATGVEVTNERECNSQPGITNLCNFSIGAMKELSAHNLKGIILNWPEASPHNNDLPGIEHTIWKMTLFLPAIRHAVEFGHIIGRHCYWRPEVEGPLERHHALGRLEWDVAWWAEQGIDINKLRVLVTEWGVDGGIAHYPAVEGWKTMVAKGLLTPEQYIAQIVEGERRAQQLSWLLGLFIFNAGSLHPWASYDHDEGIIRSIIPALHTVQPSPSPVVSPEEIRNIAWNAVGVPYNSTNAFPRYAREHDLGAPLGKEDDYGGFRFQPFVGGVALCILAPIPDETDWSNTTHISW